MKNKKSQTKNITIIIAGLLAFSLFIFLSALTLPGDTSYNSNDGIRGEKLNV